MHCRPNLHFRLGLLFPRSFRAIYGKYLAILGSLHNSLLCLRQPGILRDSFQKIESRLFMEMEISSNTLLSCPFDFKPRKSTCVECILGFCITSSSPQRSTPSQLDPFHPIDKFVSYTYPNTYFVQTLLQATYWIQNSANHPILRLQVALGMWSLTRLSLSSSFSYRNSTISLSDYIFSRMPTIEPVTTQPLVLTAMVTALAPTFP
jgi:hypothetical protein